MAELPTVEIHSPKNPSEKWIINASDFSPAIHTLWAEEVGPGVEESVAEPDAEPEPAADAPHSGMRPLIPDFVHDNEGNIVAVNVINPNDRRQSLQIPYADFDPDVYQLWSEHPRFN